MPYSAKMRTQCAGGRVTPTAGTLSFISPHTKHNESWQQYIVHICKRMSKRVAINSNYKIAINMNNYYAIIKDYNYWHDICRPKIT